jgi:hypothetical protein
MFLQRGWSVDTLVVRCYFENGFLELKILIT